MPTYEATRELLAPRADVWRFLSEPYNLADWWPGISGLQPDRRGLAPGARWQIVGDNRPSLLRKPNMSGTLLVLAVHPFERLAFHLTGERLDAELTLAEAAPDRTTARLVVSGPFLVGLKRSMPTKALTRLHGLVQTAADL
ncbi:MAG: SRPBCC domain-containing protein [Gaiellaceae bacterium]